MTFTLEEQRALAFKHYPREWFQTLSPTLSGEKRRKRQAKLRKLAVEQEITQPIRATGGSCANCDHYRKTPHTKARHCQVQSDFYGYVIPEPTDLCSSYAGPHRT